MAARVSDHEGRATAPRRRRGPSVAAAAAGQLVRAFRPPATAALHPGGAVDRGRDRGQHGVRAPPVAAPGALCAAPAGPVGVRRAPAYALTRTTAGAPQWTLQRSDERPPYVGAEREQGPARSLESRPGVPLGTGAGPLRADG